MIDANFNDLSNEMVFRVFYNLPLEDIQNVAMSCKRFYRIVSSESFSNRYFPLITTENVNMSFLEKHGSKLSLRQFALCNIKGPKELQKLMDHFKSDDKKRAMAVLIFSIRYLEKHVFENIEWDKYGVQRNHAHLLLCWGGMQLAFEHANARKAFLNNPEAKNEWEENKKSHLENIESFIKEIDDYNSCCQILNMCTFYLQIESPKELTELYREIWEKYSPCRLDPLPGMERFGQMYTHMPIEVFSGFCNFVSTKRVFESFNWWYLSNEHLQLFNDAFKDCKVSIINIALLPDIRKDTLERLIELVKRKDLFLSVTVDFLSPEVVEAKELFEHFDMGSCLNVKTWNLLD